MLAEAHVTEVPEKHAGDPGAHAAAADTLRLWLRLLSCTTAIEKRLRRGLDDHATTLPRFDVLAALDRAPDGLTLGALGRALLVSNGNMTGLVRTLEADGHLTLAPDPADRRATVARLTPGGRTHFAALARAHHGWVDAMFAGLGADKRAALYALLGELKHSIAEAQA